jgi:hypothetical protein
MKITVRKSRGINNYTVKVDNVLIETFETKKEALNFVDVNKDKLEELKNKKVEINKKKPEPVKSK